MSNSSDLSQKYLDSLNALRQWLKFHHKLGHEEEESLTLLQESIASITPEKRVSLPRPTEFDDPNAYAVYSDGGCRGNPGVGAYAFVIQNAEGKVLAEDVGFEEYTTNNKMELTGVIKGLEKIKEHVLSESLNPFQKKVFVMTDSKYVVEGMKSWITSWKKRGWKKADGKSPENLELWQKLDSLSAQFLLVSWVWVKGHGGHPQNEYCDEKLNQLMDDRAT